MNAMAAIRFVPRLSALAVAIALSVSAVPAFAQEVDHSKMHMPPAVPAATKPAVKKPAPKKPAAAKKPAVTPAAKPADPHAGHGATAGRERIAGNDAFAGNGGARRRRRREDFERQQRKAEGQPQHGAKAQDAPCRVRAVIRGPRHGA